MPPIRSAPRTRLLVATALLCAVFVFAGCVGGPEAPTALKTSGADVAEDRPSKDEAGNALARFQPEAVSQTVWANGTYHVQEHFYPVNWVPGQLGILPPPGIRFVDVTEHVPRGVPVSVVAEVNAQVTDGDVDLWVEVPWEEMWSGTWDTPQGGFSRIEARFTHENEAPIRVGLFYDEVDRSAEFAYSLRVDVLYDPQVLMDGIGAAVEIPVENATLLVDVVDADSDPTLLVWDADAKLFGRFPLKEGTTPVNLPEAGTYLVLLTPGTGHATLAVQGVADAPAMKGARQELVEFAGEAPGPEVQWTFDAERTPMQIGFFAGSPTVAMDFTGSLNGPTGRLFEASATGGPWIRPLMGFGFGNWTPMGDERLASGPYEVRAAFGNGAGPDPIQYGHTVVYMAQP